MVLSVSVTTRIVRRLTVTGWGEYLYTKCSHNQFHIRKNKENICIYIYMCIYIYTQPPFFRVGLRGFIDRAYHDPEGTTIFNLYDG